MTDHDQEILDRLDKQLDGRYRCDVRDKMHNGADVIADYIVHTTCPRCGVHVVATLCTDCLRKITRSVAVCLRCKQVHLFAVAVTYCEEIGA